MYDPTANGDNEDDGLAFMQKHGAHGWQQQFEIRDERSEHLSKRRHIRESGSSQDMFFGTSRPSPKLSEWELAFW